MWRMLIQSYGKFDGHLIIGFSRLDHSRAGYQVLHLGSVVATFLCPPPEACELFLVAFHSGPRLAPQTRVCLPLSRSNVGMPRGPKGERRPRDVIGNAVHVMRLATGEIFVSSFGT